MLLPGIGLGPGLGAGGRYLDTGRTGGPGPVSCGHTGPAGHSGPGDISECEAVNGDKRRSEECCTVTWERDEEEIQ